MAAPLTKTISLEPVTHRKKACIAIRYPFDKALNNLARTIPGSTFSITMKCWYVENHSGSIDEIVKAFKHTARVEMTLLKKMQPVAKINTERGVVAHVPTVSADYIAEVQAFALELMRKKLKTRNYSPSTQKTYIDQFKLFIHFFPNSHPEDLGRAEIEHYIMHCIEKKKVSPSTQNQVINAIKFFYEKVLKQERKTYDLDRPMKETALPEVLSQEEVIQIFEAISNTKHRLMLMIVYASGLRRSELLNLQVGDVDLDRCVVFIRRGKGKKDRQSIMAQSLIPAVQDYLDQYKPNYWLFEGRQRERYSASSLQAILKRAAEKAGIKKRVRLHMLRHSFATHLLESGTSTRYIQELLGHESPKTTELYAQVTRFGIDKIQSPLDQIASSKKLRGDAK